jgi:hydroxymethylpyrimidine/phosphomethylpyrimidine kinase
MRGKVNHPNRKSLELKPVICIGGSDSSSGAGIQVDSRALSALGVPSKNIITSITAQENGKFYHQTIFLQFSEIVKKANGQFDLKIILV